MPDTSTTTTTAASLRDARGNNIHELETPIGGGISLAPYDEANKITPEAMAADKKEVTLPDAYGKDACIGLIKSDGGPQDGRDGGDSVTYYQRGYASTSMATLTTTFTAAENNALTRRITLGEPDENGVYHVTDIVQPDKWCAYQEEFYKDGRVLRRAGVVQVTGNEPNQSTSGEDKGTALTVTWTPDEMYGNCAYIESIYYPPTTGTTPSAPGGGE